MHMHVAVGALAVALLAMPARADEPQPEHGTAPPAAAASDADRAKLEADIARELGGSAAKDRSAPADAAPAPPPPQPGAAQGTTGGNPLARVMLLPDISAIGSAALTWNDYGGEAASVRDGPYSDPHRVTPMFQELELGLQAVVDPYARADAFVSFSEQGVSVEEAYVTALTLPAGLVARGGIFFAPFGRINTQHPHTWEFVDRPLVLQRLLALDAYGGAGVDVAWLAPLPWYSELRLAYQSVEPAPVEIVEGGAVPTARAGTARLANFVDVGQRLTVGAGLSGTLSSSDTGWRHVVGGDLFVKYRPGATRAYVGVQAELLGRWMRDVPGGASDWGTYLQAVYHPGPRWGVGARWDRAPGFEDARLGGVEQRWSGVAIWAPSEFQRYRLQAGYTTLPGGGDGFETLLGMEFAIGAHGAHPF